MSLQETHLRAHYADVRNRLFGAIERSQVTAVTPPPPPPPPPPPTPQALVRRKTMLRGNFESFVDTPWNEAWLFGAAHNRSKKWPRVAYIIQETAIFYGVDEELLTSDGRTPDVIAPRHMAMYLARVLTVRSSTHIGRCFGGRDHSTILSAFRKMHRLISAGGPLAEQSKAIEAIINAAAIKEETGGNCIGTGTGTETNGGEKEATEGGIERLEKAL